MAFKAFKDIVCIRESHQVPVSVRRIVNGVVTTLTYAVNCDIATFRIFGFIDDTGVPTCISGGSGLGFIGTLQSAFYRKGW